jgi:hypothetical protein
MGRSREFLSEYSPSSDISQTIVGDYRRNSRGLKEKIEEESLSLSKKIKECSDDIEVARRTFR